MVVQLFACSVCRLQYTRSTKPTLYCNPACREGGWIKLNRYAYLNYLLKNHIRDIILICYQDPGGFLTYVQRRNPGVWGHKSGDYRKGYCNFLNNTKADFIIKRLNGPSGRRKVLWFHPPCCAVLYLHTPIIIIVFHQLKQLKWKTFTKVYLIMCLTCIMRTPRVSLNRLTTHNSYIRMTLFTMYSGFAVGVGGLSCAKGTSEHQGMDCTVLFVLV